MAQGARVSLMLLFVVAACLFSLCAALKEGETCSEDKNCDAGLHCETCVTNGNMRPRCTRVKPLNPISKVPGLPFNRYSWLTTHNSFARIGASSGTGSVIVAPTNQQDLVTAQLNNGVRVSGQCVNTTAFQPGAFLDGNPSEMDYVSSPNGLTRVFDAPGLRKFWFDDLVKHNNQSSKEGFAYECNYVLENQYGDAGMVDGYVNIIDYFPDNQNNSNPSISMVNTCYQAAGNK